MRRYVKNHIVVVVISLIAIASITIGVAVAYFTSKPEEVVNTFESGNVKIDVTEEKFNEEEAKKMYPSKEIEKDPKVNNIGSYDCYVYMKVEVDRREVRVVEDKVTIKEAEDMDLFSYEVTEGWELIKEEKTADKSTYVYAYTKGILKPGETTEAIFKKVKMVNYVEGELSVEAPYYIVATGEAIQREVIQSSEEGIKEAMKVAYEDLLES